MKKTLFIIGFMLAFILLYACKKESSGLVICGNRCSASTPWKVESLDLGLPCFATQSECRTWADAHGYSGSACVQCD